MPASQFLARVSDGRLVFVATDNGDKPIGFIELENNGHIDCFYCHPDVTRTGVGLALYNHLEQVALGSGLQRLYVEASEAAKTFFLKLQASGLASDPNALCNNFGALEISFGATYSKFFPA